MELPAALRAGVDDILAGVELKQLKQAADALSRRYRAELRDGALHLADRRAMEAYLATRLPATYAAIRASLDAVALAQPRFQPQTLLDVGAGPGSVLWAAADCWPDLADATLVETSDAAREIGARLLAEAAPIRANWIAADIVKGLPELASADLVTLAYVLDELAPDQRAPLIARLWTLTRETLVIIEPGTPSGWRRILAARTQLIEAGAHVVAPCAHAQACPIAEPDWCHFSRRVARSRVHRLAKGGDAPWEDEKYIFIAASRTPAETRTARVLAPPRRATGRVELKLCLENGVVEERLITRRDGDAFKAARRVDWGDAISVETSA